MLFFLTLEQNPFPRAALACASAILLLATLFWPAAESSAAASSMGPGELELLFEARFHADDGVTEPPIKAEAFRGGFSMRRDLIAQGGGTFQGARLSGTLTLSKLAQKLPEEAYAHIHSNGWLETAAGDEIFFRVNGLSVPVAGEPTLWQEVATVAFEADGDSAWLNRVAAFWSGNFDSRTGQAHYRVYTPVANATHSGPGEVP